MKLLLKILVAAMLFATVGCNVKTGYYPSYMYDQGNSWREYQRKNHYPRYHRRPHHRDEQRRRQQPPPYAPVVVNNNNVYSETTVVVPPQPPPNDRYRDRGPNPPRGNDVWNEEQERDEQNKRRRALPQLRQSHPAVICRDCVEPSSRPILHKRMRRN